MINLNFQIANDREPCIITRSVFFIINCPLVKTHVTYFWPKVAMFSFPAPGFIIAYPQEIKKKEKNL